MLSNLDVYTQGEIRFVTTGLTSLWRIKLKLWLVKHHRLSNRQKKTPPFGEVLLSDKWQQFKFLLLLLLLFWLWLLL
jgi:hypothetical protein